MNILEKLQGMAVNSADVDTEILKGSMTQPIDKKSVIKAIETLKKYKDGKSSLETRIVENEQWYKGRHWELIRNKYQTGTNPRPEPNSEWLFNSMANKHADAMDNYPSPNILAREEGDVIDAKILTSIFPVILERTEFEDTYSDGWWYKIKNGTACYGVFWDATLDNGLGDISVKKIDLLNVFWKPGINKIQETPNLFIVELRDNDELLKAYPQLDKSKLGSAVDVKEYVHDDDVDTSNCSVVVDWYYKKHENGKTVLHYAKFVGEELLFSSENEADYINGWYEDGEYPIVFDVLYPEEGTPYGMGYIDLFKDTQMYIDKFGQVVIENLLKAGKNRWLVKDGIEIDKEALMDWSRDFIPYSGNSDGIYPLAVKQLDSGAYNFIEMKINEMKETSGNRDVSQGSTSSGVTAAAAISALQAAGNKLSRDIIKASYRSYAKLMYMVLERIRQFYTDERQFRITGERGKEEFIRYSNARLIAQLVQGPAGQTYRKPIFDIRIVPEKTDPFARAAQNEMAKEFFNLGFFNPELADQALIALSMMDFEGKDMVVDQINRNKTLLVLLQQSQMQLAMLTGGMAGGMVNMPQTQGQSSGVGNIGFDGALNNYQTDYGQRLAERARVNVNDGGTIQNL